MNPKLDYHEIAPGLFVGSMPPYGAAVACAGFDVLAFCASEWQPHAAYYPGVRVVRAPLEDDGSPMTETHYRQAFGLAGYVARRVREGKRVLVTCLQGRNRSGFVAALALAALTGAPGASCAAAVKRRRKSPHGEALCNREFFAVVCGIPPKRNPGVVTRTAAREAGLMR